MSDSDLNPGILIGSAALFIGLFAALIALYLWAVKRAKRKFEKLEDPQARAVLPWLSPLLLPALAILCLGLIAALSKAYARQSWPDVSAFAMIFPALAILWFWLKIHTKP